MRACIFGLVRGGDFKFLNNLRQRNILLKKNFISKFPYDIIIFHEGDFDKNTQSSLEEEIDNKIIFIDVSKEAFNNFGKNINDSLIGYKHMCRFNSIVVYDFLSDYDYALRLDDDSYIMSEITNDIFLEMEKDNVTYVGPKKHTDSHELTTNTLIPFVLNYLKNKNITPKCGFENINMENFYNNIYATKLDFWKREDVKDFLNEIELSNGIYDYRWGDSTIQALAIKIFEGYTSVRTFGSFKYKHGSHGWSNNPTINLLNKI